MCRLLQQALGGCELLRLLVTVSPCDREETLRTLNFASRAKELRSYLKPVDFNMEDFSEAEELDAFARALSKSGIGGVWRGLRFYSV